MASWRGHIRFSSALGVAYGGISWYQFGVDWPVAAVGGLLTSLGGLLPDLDSDSGVPVRELFGLLSFVLPVMLLRRLAHHGLTPEQTLLAFAGVYAFVRYGLSNLFKNLSVHRGMYHSIPAMICVGMIVYLGYKHPSEDVRLFMAFGTMLGFLSHLVLDELCAVDFRGLTPTLNQFAGTALKLKSKSMFANLVCYSLLGILSWTTYEQYERPADRQSEPVQFRERPAEKQAPRWKPSPARPDPPPISVPGRRG
ncbi:MAG: metal-dependent hydrolase [Gemmataceae bacterium]